MVPERAGWPKKKRRIFSPPEARTIDSCDELGEPSSFLGGRGKRSADRPAASATKLEHDGSGFGASLDLIKIDARNGRGLLMGYDMNLNTKTELTMVGSSASTGHGCIR